MSVSSSTQKSYHPSHEIRTQSCESDHTITETKTVDFNHTMAASWVAFLGRILIERTFFQNTQIPKEALLLLSNDLIKALATSKQETLSLRKEAVILWKSYYSGEPLTADEKAYEKSAKKIDVLREVFNGISLSSTALLGQSFVQSLSLAVQSRLLNHIPAIVGYYGVALFGTDAISSIIDGLLSQFNLTTEQKTIAKPWFEMIGKLALGFTPRVHATEKGLHYNYPSFDHSSQTFSQGQVATVEGNTLTIEQEGVFQTPKGDFEGVYSANFNLREVNEIGEESVRIRVTDREGRNVPIVFKRIEGMYGPEIQVICDNQELAEYWTRQLPPPKNCLNDIALGTLSALSLKNPLPLAVGTFACLSTIVSAQLFPFSFNVEDPSNLVLSVEQARMRYQFLEEKEATPEGLTPDEKAEMRNLLPALESKTQTAPLTINMLDQKYNTPKYYVVFDQKAYDLTARFNAITNTVYGLYKRKRGEVTSAEAQVPFIEGGIKASALLLSAKFYLKRRSFMDRLIDSNDLLSQQINCNTECNIAIRQYLKKAHQKLGEIQDLFKSGPLEEGNLVSFRSEDSGKTISEILASDTLEMLTLNQKLESSLGKYSTEVSNLQKVVNQVIRELEMSSVQLDEDLENGAKRLQEAAGALDMLSSSLEMRKEQIKAQANELNSIIPAEISNENDALDYLEKVTNRMSELYDAVDFNWKDIKFINGRIRFEKDLDLNFTTARDEQERESILKQLEEFSCST